MIFQGGFVMNEEVEIVLSEISMVLSPSSSYAILLKEKQGKRQLAVIMDAHAAGLLKAASMKAPAPRPFTHNLMTAMIQEGGLSVDRALVYEIKSGIFYTRLSMYRQDGSAFELDVRISDALILAHLLGFPIFVFEEVLEREKLRYISSDGSSYTVSVNAVDLPSLQKALEQAVKQEDYERAAQLRDEILKRENEMSRTDADGENE